MSESGLEAVSMEIVWKNAAVFSHGNFHRRYKSALLDCERELSKTLNCEKYVILPGFADVHVHLREPGFSYKETIKSGTMAAARGGYTDIGAMPNLSPVPDTLKHLRKQFEIIERDAAIRVHPYGSITVDEKGEALAELDDMAQYVLGFSDDGKGVQSEEIMREAMLAAKRLNKIIAAHCEDYVLRAGGYIHAGDYCRRNGHKGISPESEWKPIERDLKLVKETGCAYHVCHVSAKESVELIREAKKEGMNVTCETAPHYLLLNEECIQDHGRFKMNPPIRSEKDREAILEGLIDGTIDMIATDHAPHSDKEKSGGLKDSMMGIVGLETAFPLLYTELVKTGIMSMEILIDKMAVFPRKRFGLQLFEDDYSIWDLKDSYYIDPRDFLSMGKSTPFEGNKVYGRCLATVMDGKIVWMDKRIREEIS